MKIIGEKKYRMGQQHPNKPELVFLRYGRKDDGVSRREEWVTPTRLQEFRETVNQQCRERNQTEEGQARIRRARQKQWDSGYMQSYMREYRRKWKANPFNRMIHSVKSRMRIAIKHQGLKKESKSEQTLGCTFSFFRDWIQSQFRNGMTMENYGKVWVIDHIIPVSAWNLFDPEQFTKCFHYTNCQPLFKKENEEKNDKFQGTNGRHVVKPRSPSILIKEANYHPHPKAAA